MKNYKITQIEKEEIIVNLLLNKKIYRFNTENETLCDLGDKSLNVIRRDMEKDVYIYFMVESD